MSFDFITMLNYNFKEEIPENIEYAIGSNCIGVNPEGRSFNKNTPLDSINAEGLVLGKLDFDPNLIAFLDLRTYKIRLFDEFFAQNVIDEFTNNLIPSFTLMNVDTLGVALDEIKKNISDFPHIIPYKRGGARPHCSTFFLMVESVSEGYDLVAAISSNLGLGAAFFGRMVVITTPSKKDIQYIQKTLGYNVYRNGVCLFPID